MIYIQYITSKCEGKSRKLSGEDKNVRYLYIILSLKLFNFSFFNCCSISVEGRWQFTNDNFSALLPQTDISDLLMYTL